MTYIDAHCHLGSRQFDEDRDEMIGRMIANDVSKAIIICCGKHDLEHGIKLREQYPGFKLAIGIHPQDLENDYSEERLTSFRETVIEVKPDMIGEIGLDYYSHLHTKTRQLHFFKEQLKLAQEFDLPVDIHTRKAAQDTLNILKEYPVRGIIHSYSGSLEMAQLYLKLGYYLSFGASVLFPGAKRPKEVVGNVPLERMLIETDAPYQSPIKDHRHESSDVIRIYEAIAGIRQLDPADLAAVIEDNFDHLFR